MAAVFSPFPPPTSPGSIKNESGRMWAGAGVWLSDLMCVSCYEDSPFRSGVVFFRLLSEQRVGAETQRTTLLKRRTDRGSDSTFQMAGRARSILVRGSATPSARETANYFLLLPPVCFLPLPDSLLLFPMENTAFLRQVLSHLAKP